MSYRHLCRQRDVERNLSDVGAIARKAAAGRVQLIVFPECILTGYMFDSGADLEAHAVPKDDPEILEIAAWCAEHSITVIVGFCERTETKALSDKIGTDAPRYAFGVTGIPRED